MKKQYKFIIFFALGILLLGYFDVNIKNITVNEKTNNRNSKEIVTNKVIKEKSYMIKFENGVLKKDKNLKTELKKYGQMKAYLDNIDSVILTMNDANKKKLLEEQKKVLSIKEDNLPNFKTE